MESSVMSGQIAGADLREDVQILCDVKYFGFCYV